MDATTERVNEGFDRLQRLLLAMRIGEELRASDAADVTGLSREVCHAVLSGLERAGLMTHEDEDRFTRRSLDLIES
jgi:DNA-binding IclR family transcriptional regulator